MQCDRCGKNEALVHWTKIEDNHMASMNLCGACAAEKGVDPAEATAPFTLTDLVGRVARGEAAPGPCPFCGLGFEEFKKTGRLGCPQCYEAFDTQLKGVLRRLHGGVQHLGKVYLPPDPSQSQRIERLAGLRRKLSRAVETEDFERAAEIRDLIRELEGAGSD
jgi:protein arginine kinase activator